MGSSHAHRPIRLPLPEFEKQPLPLIRQAGRCWYRVHPSHFNPIHFSLVPTHRFSHPDCPDKLLCLAIDLETCLWERFGDHLYDGKLALPKSLWNSFSISKINAPFLDLCDFANTATRAALQVDLSALMSAAISVPQQWGSAVQKHPSAVAGIKFKSRFTSQDV